MAKIGRISFPSTGRIGKLSELFGIIASSVDAALPVKFVSTLSQLNGIGMTEATPAGTLAVLTADGSGLAAGAEFVLTPDGKWKLHGACSALNIDTFVSSLSSTPNVRVLPGAQAWNAATSSLVVFTTAGGAFVNTTQTKIVHGTGKTNAAVGVGKVHTVAVAFPPLSFTTTPKNILVSANSSRVTPAALSRTKDGFSLRLANWSSASLESGIDYWWTAIA